MLLSTATRHAAINNQAIALGKPVTAVGELYITPKGIKSKIDHPARQMGMANEMLAITPVPRSTQMAIGTKRQRFRGTRAGSKKIGQTNVNIVMTTFAKTYSVMPGGPASTHRPMETTLRASQRIHKGMTNCNIDVKETRRAARHQARDWEDWVVSRNPPESIPHRRCRSS